MGWSDLFFRFKSKQTKQTTTIKNEHKNKNLSAKHIWCQEIGGARYEITRIRVLTINVWLNNVTGVYNTTMHIYVLQTR